MAGYQVYLADSRLVMASHNFAGGSLAMD